MFSSLIGYTGWSSTELGRGRHRCESKGAEELAFAWVLGIPLLLVCMFVLLGRASCATGQAFLQGAVVRPICKPAQKPPDVTATCFLRCMCRCDSRWRATVERGLTSHSCPYRPVLAAVAGAADHVSMEACAGRIVPWASGARDEALQHCAGFASRSAPMASQGAGFDEPQQQLKQLALARGPPHASPKLRYSLLLPRVTVESNRHALASHRWLFLPPALSTHLQAALP